MIEQVDYLKKLKKEIKKDKGFHFDLNHTGVFHMERKLPFLLVYRPMENAQPDPVIINLLKNEASYMICPQEQYDDYRDLLLKTVKEMSDEFGAFLILEIWPEDKLQTINDNIARFELLSPGDVLRRIVKPVKNYIENMDLAGLDPSANLISSEKRCPDEKQPLLNRKDLKQLECLLLGLKIAPFYRDVVTRKTYPLLERKLYSEFSEVFKKAVFDFVTIQTNHKVAGFQSLARRKIKPDVWEIDKQLYNIDNKIQFLMLVSPVNGNMAWKEFKKSKFKKTPVFHYRMMPFDPELLKRKLYNIKIEDIDDPTLGFLFHEKRAEVDKMLSMLNERESCHFFYGSMQLYGTVNEQLLSDAKEILQTFPVQHEEKKPENEYYSVEEFAELARQELRRLKKTCPDVIAEVNIKDSIDNLLVDKGKLNIPVHSKIPKSRAEALIQHEVGTHVLTYYNGQSQPLKLLCSGIPGYEELQEGIAVLAEHLSGGLSISRMQTLAARVIAVDSLNNHHDFNKTFNLLVNEYNFNPQKAFFITTRVYRGGGFTKDAIYLRGLVSLMKHLKEDNPLENLLIGKIRQNYLPVIEELIERQILYPVKLKPGYLSDAVALKRLDAIKNTENITDLINLEV
ncbi:MAG: flavohemoglobin expression-modulating QEGLA motif protein [Prolixibacteraceae bacterium]